MQAGLHIAPSPFAIARERLSVRVKHVAAILDCDQSQVRRLVDRGELEAHRIGKRGVRIYLDSVDDYRARGVIKAARAPQMPHKPLISKATRIATAAALADLRADGII
jgi:excisionase family DNA binding protein